MAIPLRWFPYPVPAILEVAGNLKSKTTEWLPVEDYRQRIANCIGNGNHGFDELSNLI